MKNYQELDVLNQLKKKRDVIVDPIMATVTVNRGRKRLNDLGNGSWGKIDYLTNHRKYTLLVAR